MPRSSKDSDIKMCDGLRQNFSVASDAPSLVTVCKYFSFLVVLRVGQNRIYIRIYDRMFGDFPAKNTVHTPYIYIYIWFWPALVVLAHRCWYTVYLCVHYTYTLYTHTHTHTHARTHTLARTHTHTGGEGGGAYDSDFPASKISDQGDAYGSRGGAGRPSPLGPSPHSTAQRPSQADQLAPRYLTSFSGARGVGGSDSLRGFGGRSFDRADRSLDATHGSSTLALQDAPFFASHQVHWQ